MTNHSCLLVFCQMQADDSLFDLLVRPLSCFNCLFVFSHKFITHHSCFACLSLIECAADPKPSYRMACRTCFLFSENQPYSWSKVQIDKGTELQKHMFRYRIIEYKTYLSHSFPHKLSLRLKTNPWSAVTLFSLNLIWKSSFNASKTVFLSKCVL